MEEAVVPADVSADAQDVRHHYPLAIRDASFATALRLFLQTLPYALARFGILLGLSILGILWGVVTFGGGAWVGEKIHPYAGFGWIAVGCGGMGWAWTFILRYALYLIKCGHVAVLTELIVRGQIGNGSEGMFSYGKRVVKDRFLQVNVLFALEEARRREMHTIAFLGKNGGFTLGAAEIEFVIEGQVTARIQEAHKFLLHALCEQVETGLPKE